MPKVSTGDTCLNFRSLPPGWVTSRQNQSADGSLDSDADPATSKIAGITLEANDLNEDVGLYEGAGPVYVPLVLRTRR